MELVPKRRARTHLYTPSPFNLYHALPNPSSDVSSIELRRVLDSILDQVDWLEVAVKVANNRAPSIYCRAIEKILVAHIDQLGNAEGEGDSAAKVENSIDSKECMSEDTGYDGGEDEDDNEEMEGDKEKDDDDDDEGMEGYEDEDEDDEMDDNEYNGDNMYTSG